MELKDSVWGSIRIKPVQEELIDLPEMQRTILLRQLSGVYKVFSGATHTRLEHSVGGSYTAGRIADRLGLPENEKLIVEVAMTVHDVGHTPGSHALECLFRGGHEKVTADIITGKRVLDLYGKVGQIPKILAKHGINETTIADLVTQNFKGKTYLQQIIHHVVDADQLDYLIRDSRSLGVKIADIDIDRTMDVLVLHKNQIGILEKGIPQMEMILFAKSQMYSQVYIHRTAAAAEAMLLEAVKSSQSRLGDIMKYGDDELVFLLELKGNQISKELAGRLKARELYKTAYRIETRNILPKNKRLVKKLYALDENQQSDLQKKILKESKLEQGQAIIRMPVKRLAFEEPRLKKINMPVIYKNGDVKDLSEASDLAKLLVSKEGSSSYFSVYCSEENKDKVRRATEKVLEKYFS
jgi:HD superfamily phosphohydrolase